METKYIKMQIEDMQADKDCDNLTEYGENLLKEMKALLKVCEQKETKQQSNCNLPNVMGMCCPHCGSEDIVWYGLSGDCVCNKCGEEGNITL